MKAEKCELTIGVVSMVRLQRWPANRHLTLMREILQEVTKATKNGWLHISYLSLPVVGFY